MASKGVMGKAASILATLEAGVGAHLDAAFHPCYPRPRKDGVKAVRAVAGTRLCTVLHIAANRDPPVYPYAAGGTIS